MDKGYKILEHPADIRVRAFGKTKEELFLNTTLGMNEILRPELKNKNRKRKIKRDIKVKSIDLNALLVDFLSEILYQAQTNKEIYNRIEFKKLENDELEAGLFGNKIESFGEDIKAATHHNLEIKRKKGLFEVTILFDV